MKGFYKELHIDYINKLASKIIAEIDRQNIYISVIGKFREISELIKILLNNENVYIVDTEIISPEINGYDDEYILTLQDDYKLWCEPMKRKNYDGYIGFDTEKVYVFENCNQKTVAGCKDDEVTVVYYDCYGYINDECSDSLNTKAMAETENKDIDEETDSDLHKNVRTVAF